MAISILIHGWWKAGKSTLAVTAPGPRVAFDVEGGLDYVDTPTVDWDPYTQDPNDLELTDNTTVLVAIPDWDTADTLMKWLKSGKHPFESVVLDSLHELQYRLKQNVVSPGEVFDPEVKMTYEHWRLMLNKLGLMVRELRDLSRRSSVKRINVVLISGTDDERLPAKPLLEGGLRRYINGFFDIVGYLRVGADRERHLDIEPTAQAEAGCRVKKISEKWGSSIPNPNLKEMVQIANS